MTFLCMGQDESKFPSLGYVSNVHPLRVGMLVQDAVTSSDFRCMSQPTKPFPSCSSKAV